MIALECQIIGGGAIGGFDNFSVWNSWRLDLEYIGISWATFSAVLFHVNLPYFKL